MNLKYDIFVYNLPLIKRYFFKVKTVKTNDKIRRFGVVMTPLSRKMLKCKLQTLSNVARKLT